MQIKSIILYHKDGRVRTLDFRLGEVNIITGESKTGKTVLVEIVNYCLASSDFNVFGSVIRKTVAWFAVVLQLDEEQIFVARQNAAMLNLSSTSAVYFDNAAEVKIPAANELTANSDIANLRKFLARKIGISEYTNMPETGTRPPLAVTFRHSVPYSFQPQTTVAQKDHLFYGQTDRDKAQAMKDTLPYFLGAVEEEAVRIEQNLASEKRELNRLLRDLKNDERIVEDGNGRLQQMVNEAKELQLIANDSDTSEPEAALAALKEVAKWEFDYDAPEGENETLKRLLEQKSNLSKRLGFVKDEIRAVESFIEGSENYSSEATQQRARLKSIELYREASAVQSCPLCDQTLETEVPSVTAINRSLEELDRNLQTTIAQNPRLSTYTGTLSKDRDDIVAQLDAATASIKAIYREQEETARLRDLSLRRGRSIGRISLFLESFQLVEENSDLQVRIASARDRIAELETRVSADEREGKLNHILNQINSRMTRWSESLDLEYKGSPLRFDLRKLTVFADTPIRPEPLGQMGSAANWVGIHLLAHFALHSHFVNANRPVPRFIIIDQPSQAYYPPTNKEDNTHPPVENSDDKAVQDMYEFIFKAHAELKGSFQVIVTDHAKLLTEDFSNATLEEWRYGNKLIPLDWISEESHDLGDEEEAG